MILPLTLDEDDEEEEISLVRWRDLQFVQPATSIQVGVTAVPMVPTKQAISTEPKDQQDIVQIPVANNQEANDGEGNTLELTNIKSPEVILGGGQHNVKLKDWSNG